jgi:hypothetical protein
MPAGCESNPQGTFICFLPFAGIVPLILSTVSGGSPLDPVLLIRAVQHVFRGSFQGYNLWLAEAIVAAQNVITQIRFLVAMVKTSNQQKIRSGLVRNVT